MIVLDFLVCLIVLFFGFEFKKKFKCFNSYDKGLLDKLFAFHIIAGIAFYFYVINYGGDATNYWFITYYDTSNLDDVLLLIEKGSATGYMLLLNYIPAQTLNLSFFTGSIIYTVLGYMGFVYFYVILKENIFNLYWLQKVKIVNISGFPTLFPMLFFLPNLHFWSSGIGKDTLLFFCIALFAYSIKNIRKRLWGIGVAVSLSVFVRPHITLFLLISFGIGFALDSRLRLYQRILILIIITISCVAMYDYVLQFVKLESLNSEVVKEYYSTSAANLSQSRTGSSVDISGYPFFLKVFTFLYRPLFIDSTGILGVFASIENLILLLFTIKCLLNKPIKGFKNSNYLLKGLLLFFVLGSIAFSLMLGNFGIMLRQKTPFIIIFLIIGFWVLTNNMLEKNIKRKFI